MRKPKRIHMSETISSIMLSTLPRKRRDPGAPMISCEIGGRTFTRSLLDTGASVNILPKGVYDLCPLGELQPLFIELSLADGSVRRPHRGVEDVIVKVENCYFPFEFIIVDMKSTKDLTDFPIILGRPFLATAKAITDWSKGKVIFQVGDNTMKVSIDVSFSCVVKTQRRWSNKIYKTELTKTRYNNQVLGKYRVDPQRAGLTLIAELTWSNLGLRSFKTWK